MPTSGGMLGEVQDGLLQEALANLGPEWQNQPLPAKIEEAKRRLIMMQEIDQTANFALDKHKGKVDELEQVQQELPGMPNVMAKRSIFTLKTAQSPFATPVPPVDPQSGNNAGSNLPKFQDASQLRDFLVQTEPNQVSAQLGELVSINPELEQSVSDAVARFYETNDPQRQIELASIIYDSLPQSARNSANEMEGDTQVSGIEQTVKASNEAVRAAAIKLAQSSPLLNPVHDPRQVPNKKCLSCGYERPQSEQQCSVCGASKFAEPGQQPTNEKLIFNSSKFKKIKTAQHKGLENVMMFGPDQVRVDPFTGQLVSKWHIYERNKGYGIKPGDALDIDFEAIWRGNIMDKYSQPYRNAEGEWVGGYINKRFEVDRMVPEGNNYQLKPGEKRRAYLPEYRSTEARLQKMRAESTIGEHKPTYANKDKPTDWSKDGTEFAAFNFKRAKNDKFASAEVKKKSSLTKQSDFFEKFFPKNKPTSNAPTPMPQRPSNRIDLDQADFGNQSAVAVAPAGPQPDVDFRIDEKVEILQRGNPTGMFGQIINWEGSGFPGAKNKPSARVRIQGVPGGSIVPLTDLRKVHAQISLPQGGQPKDLNALPGADEPMKGGPQCSNCGSQLPNPTNVSNQRKGNLTNCPKCNAPLNVGGQWKNPFNQQKQAPFNQNIVINPNMQRAAQIAMPSNANVVNRAIPETMTRRTRQYIPQPSSKPAIPRSPEAVMLSDENADNIDQGHLDNVQHSANALGL